MLLKLVANPFTYGYVVCVYFCGGFGLPRARKAVCVLIESKITNPPKLMYFVVDVRSVVGRRCESAGKTLELFFVSFIGKLRIYATIFICISNFLYFRFVVSLHRNSGWTLQNIFSILSYTFGLLCFVRPTLNLDAVCLMLTLDSFCKLRLVAAIVHPVN